jgi:class 3 adenylate cyclase
VTTFPQGTVTFVFTDIEGSTALLKRLGDRYADALADHRRLIRDDFAARGGQEIDTQGDAFFFCFVRARDAVAAAVAAQRALAAHAWPDGSDLRVRMSLHTGEPVLGEEGYVGIDVHRAARICAAGHGGQVLLSATTAALVASGLPEGVGEVELGEVRLADLDVPERVYQLTIDGLQTEFPPLRTKQDEPLDLGAAIEQRVEQFVVQSIERAFSGMAPPKLDELGPPPPARLESPPRARSEPPSPPPRVPKTTRMAAWGLVNVILLVLAIVVIVLLVRLAF